VPFLACLAYRGPTLQRISVHGMRPIRVSSSIFSRLVKVSSSPSFVRNAQRQGTYACWNLLLKVVSFDGLYTVSQKHPRHIRL